VSMLLLEMALRSGLSSADVSRIVSNAPIRYKSYEIAKRTGGTRTIAQPSRELKALQRIAIDIVLSKFPVHARATAYESGRSILINANQHVGHKALMKLDFLNFFPSIKVGDFHQFLEHNKSTFTDADIEALTQILFWGKGSPRPVCLSIGAPSSPRMSNIMMYEIDVQADALANNLGVTYTRYADDVTVSGGAIETLYAFEKAFRRIISNASFPRLRFNSKKRGIYVRGQRQMVTGLVLTPSGNVSIGRERKRLISAMMHRASLGQLNVDDLQTLKGLLAFAAGCEPNFLTRLSRKYGEATVKSVFQTN
jgi:RNA-directed DNA polymerase